MPRWFDSKRQELEARVKRLEEILEPKWDSWETLAAYEAAGGAQAEGRIVTKAELIFALDKVRCRCDDGVPDSGGEVVDEQPEEEEKDLPGLPERDSVDDPPPTSSLSDTGRSFFIRREQGDRHDEQHVAPDPNVHPFREFLVSSHSPPQRMQRRVPASTPASAIDPQPPVPRAPSPALATHRGHQPTPRRSQIPEVHAPSQPAAEPSAGSRRRGLVHRAFARIESAADRFTTAVSRFSLRRSRRQEQDPNEPRQSSEGRA